MKLVVGLGNPGPRYRRTRHNLGFRVVDLLARRWDVVIGGRRHEAESGVGEVAGVRAVLAKPLTFMNCSGEAVAKLRRSYRLAVDEVVAVYDDLDLPLGRVRVRADGSAGGHNGVASLIAVLGKGFPRVRIGIGRPPGGGDPVGYVLERFTAEEEAVMEPALDRAASAVETLVRDGLGRAMNAFNRRPDTG
jgi:peptidyl-tRNA hydrolase, PTH1 family